MFAVAVGAGRGLQNAFGDGLSVNALGVGVEDAGVTLAAGGGDVLLPDFRLGIGDGENVVRAVAVVAGRGFVVALQDRSSVNALLIGFDRTDFGEHILRGEFGIGVAGAAGVGQMLFADG